MSDVVIVYEPAPTVVVTDPAAADVVASDVGTQGEPGPAGPAGGEHKSFVFTTPSTSWPCPHNLGYRPNVAVIVDGVDVSDGVTVNHSDENNCTVLSGLPIAGRAELS